MASFKYMLCFFSICFLLCACNEENVQASQEKATEKECTNPKIQAELAGNLLEFNRDEVEIWIRNPDKNDQVYRYIDVSQDCSIRRVDNTYRIGISGHQFFKRPIRASLSLPSDKIIKNKFFEAEKILNKFQDKIVSRNDELISIWYENEKNEEHGFYIVLNTRDLEINSRPILFICEKWHGCDTQYVHPSGILIGYKTSGYFKKQNILEVVDVVNNKLNTYFLKHNIIPRGL